jgi:hypothetical protein
LIQDLDTQLQVVLTALQDVVAPALAGGEKHVAEQLMLSVVTLNFVKSRLPEARRFYRLELRALVDLAREAEGIAGAHYSLEDAAAEGQRALSDPEADLADYEVASRRLRDRITATSAQSVGQPHGSQLDRLILERQGSLIAQSRQWCVPFGFELQPESLPPPAW